MKTHMKMACKMVSPLLTVYLARYLHAHPSEPAAKGLACLLLHRAASADHIALRRQAGLGCSDLN